MKSIIAIGNITFNHVLAYGDEFVQEIAVESINISYTVYHGDNKIDGKLTLDQDEYRDKTYSDLINVVGSHFISTVEGVEIW